MIGNTDHSTYKPALSYHPLANLFPMIEGPERVKFRESIRDNGLRRRIVMHEGQILDGRNRYRELLGLQMIDHSTDWKTSPYFREWGTEEGDGDDPLSFVLDLNLERRHLNESQRASVAARMATMTRGERTDLKDGSSLGNAVENISRAEAAERLNVSERSVNSAKAVQEKGAPELVDAVDQGVLPVSVAEKLLVLPVEEQTRLVTEETPAVIKNAAKKAQRAEKEIKLAAKQKALPEKRYGVVYVDPAWRFEPRSRETGLDRAADNHYPTMTTEEICALDVGGIAASDCAMFMWATVPMLPDALKVMSSWGFAYKSHYIWDKTPWDGDGADNAIAGRQGTGFWGRVNHELLLIGTRGNPTCPAPGENFPTVYREVAGAHSAKPEHYARMIEGYFPNLPKIELNARKPRDGWDVWGNESEGKGRLPDEPTEVPTEFIVPGLPKNHSASFAVRRNSDGTFSERTTYSFPTRGGSGPFLGKDAYANLADALTVAVNDLLRSMRSIAAGNDSMVSAASQKAGQKTVDWLVDRASEWGLNLSRAGELERAARERREPHWLERDAPTEDVDSDHIEESSVNAAYIAELQKVADLKGKLHQSTAEPVMRAAYAERIPLEQLAADLGHPKGTIKTWANRLKLTSIERMHQNQAAPFTAADADFQLQGEVPDINGDVVRAGLKVTLTEDVVASAYEVRRVYKNGNISISNASGHQQVIKAGEFVLANDAEEDA